jgi:hypothetical protein
MRSGLDRFMTNERTKFSLAHRIDLLLQHLGASAAHFCVRAPLDLLGLLRDAPHLVVSVTLVGANARPESLEQRGSRVLWISGDRGSAGSVMAAGPASFPRGQATVQPSRRCS